MGLVAITTLLCAAMLAAQPNLLMVVLTLIFLFTGSVLSFSRSVGSFLQFQRAKCDPDVLRTVASTISDGNLATCAECGGSFQKQEVIVHEGLQICPRCKPLFIQKVKEGVPVSAAGGGRENSVDQST